MHKPPITSRTSNEFSHAEDGKLHVIETNNESTKHVEVTVFGCERLLQASGGAGIVQVRTYWRLPPRNDQQFGLIQLGIHEKHRGGVVQQYDKNKDEMPRTGSLSLSLSLSLSFEFTLIFFLGAGTV